MKKKKLCILPHMGLGDMIVLNGMVRVVCDTVDECIVIAKHAYRSSLESLFGNIKNLHVLMCDEANDVSEAYGADGEILRQIEAAGFSIIRLGWHTGNGAWQTLDSPWSRALYRQVGLSPELMYARFHVTRNVHAEDECADAFRKAAGQEGYIIMHDDPSRGLVIDRTLLPTPGRLAIIHVDDPRVRRQNIFEYAKAIEGAVAFHGMDSCFMIMIDFLQLDVRTVLHAYVKDPDMSTSLYKKPPDMVLRKWTKKMPLKIEFVCHNMWQAFADHHIDLPHETKHLYTPAKEKRPLKAGDVVFVKTDLLDAFCDKILPALTDPCVIISGHSDLSPSKKAWDSLHRSPFVKSWLAMHLARESPKATCIPIGFAEPDRPHGDQQAVRAAMDAARKRDVTTGKRRCTVWFPMSNDTHPIRSELASVSHIRLARSLEKMPFREYLDELSRHAFVVCPRGNGIDIHRVYEALAVGTVPIYVSRDDPPGCYATMPVVVVKGGARELATVLDELPDFMPCDRDDIERRVLSSAALFSMIK